MEDRADRDFLDKVSAVFPPAYTEPQGCLDVTPAVSSAASSPDPLTCCCSHVTLNTDRVDMINKLQSSELLLHFDQTGNRLNPTSFISVFTARCDEGDAPRLPQGSRTASTLSAATLASLGGASSRRGSCDTSFSMETEASIRDMKVVHTEICVCKKSNQKITVTNYNNHN